LNKLPWQQSGLFFCANPHTAPSCEPGKSDISLAVFIVFCGLALLPFVLLTVTRDYKLHVLKSLFINDPLLLVVLNACRINDVKYKTTDIRAKQMQKYFLFTHALNQDYVWHPDNNSTNSDGGSDNYGGVMHKMRPTTGNWPGQDNR